MELIDRYLQAVAFWLPSPGKQDILAELSEDIHAQVEEHERIAGRSLSEEEVVGLLKTRGRPVLIANAYQSKQYLVGPMLFPIYSLVLKIVTACFLVPTLVVHLTLAVHSSLAMPHRPSAVTDAIASAMTEVWATALVALGWATVIFAVLERSGAASKLMGMWNPRNLPRLRNPNQISRSSALFEGALTVVLVLWWVATMASPLFVQRTGMQVLLAPVWRIFFWAFTAVWLGQAGLALTNALSPYWTPLRASLRLLLDGAGSVLLCSLAQAHIVRSLVLPAYTADRSIVLKDTINLWAERCFPILVIAGVTLATIDAFRILRVLRSTADPCRPFITGGAGSQSL